MSLQLIIGPDVINSYRRLSYSPWHAIAEFVDNATQAYFNNKADLDTVYESEGDHLLVSVVYDRNSDLLRITDNSVGMSYEELQHGLHIGLPPSNAGGRSRYGLGMKTAACWMGDQWSVRTKKLGESLEYSVSVDVRAVALGKNGLVESSNPKPESEHYTIVEVSDHNRIFHGRTIGKIKRFLRSMYREDLRNGIMTLEWQGEPLEWEGIDEKLLRAKDGTRYKKNFEFVVDGKRVWGWVGILDAGSRAEAGFSILHSGRVIRGWPDSWRPGSLYGQLQGSNDLVNQRLVGEINLDEFEVTHTKDDILWLGDQEEQVEAQLRIHCGGYRTIAQQRRKKENDQRGPTELETSIAIGELKRELESPEIVDAIVFDDVPPPEIVEEAFQTVSDAMSSRMETFSVQFGVLTAKGYIAHDLSVNDPYVVYDAAKADEVLIIINMSHPHLKQIKGSEGLLNYFRHCTYDALAEWKASHKAAAITPDTIKLIKDAFLRASMSLELKEEEEREERVIRAEDLEEEDESLE